MSRVDDVLTRMFERTQKILEVIDSGGDPLPLISRMDGSAPWELLSIQQASALDILEAEREADERLSNVGTAPFPE